MKRIPLGDTGLDVSELCLGTMTWGSQNTEAEGHAQIDMARDHGINFMDTAEMYPVAPVTKETVGDTETIIGNWLARNGGRDDWIIATKIAGPNPGFVREGRGIYPDTVRSAVDASLKRLQTDYIDIYQFHWPNRGSYHFRQNWAFDPSKQDAAAEMQNMADVAGTLADLVDEGRIRHFGLSNDSAWGALRWNAALKAAGAPRVATVQNEYSLLCRLYDTDMAEVSVNEGITLLAYSPLAAGLLTGKYQNGAVPEGSRLTRGENLGGRTTDRAFAAIDAYHVIARDNGLDPTQMAIAWTRTRPFPTIPIIGATSTGQLALNIGAAEVKLGDDVLEAVASVHRELPLPY